MQPQANNRPAQAAGAADASQRLIGLAHATLEDLRQEAPQREITLDSKLDDDLGLDSLARVELFARIERELGVRLPELLFASAETLRDIAAALAASPSYVAPPT
ncbi:MAG TPA: phosphopantetheine-binding protein, partial [Steroidobacter sp.]|nr:phosphopantetheine-binding protein [Steroidobacter sp.]